jgi:hypothetical protein
MAAALLGFAKAPQLHASPSVMSWEHWPLACGSQAFASLIAVS